MADFHVIIIGAGCTGLLLAHGLKKAGIRYSIFEAELDPTRSRQREWTMGVHWAQPMLKALLPQDLYARLGEATGNPYYIPPPDEVMNFFDCVTGKKIRTIPTPGMVRYNRRKLRDFLTQGVDVVYGSTFQAVEYTASGVTVSFDNGRKVSGSIVVGADGPHSSVRSAVYGEAGQAAKFPGINTNLKTRLDPEVAQNLLSIHKSFMAGIYPNTFWFVSVLEAPDADPSTWTFNVMNSWRGLEDFALPVEDRLRVMKERASSLSEPFRSSIVRLPDDIEVGFDQFSYWIPIPRDNHGGRITLCGDAAHPMTPHRGQGFNHAINSAKNLVEALVKARNGTSLHDTISVYDDEVMLRGAAEISAALESSKTITDREQVGTSDLVTKGVTRTNATME